MKKILKIAAWKIRMLEEWFLPAALLAARIHVGLAFWRSGMTKYPDIKNAIALFEDEYIPEWEKNHVKEWLGFNIPFPVPSPEFAAYAATYMELGLSALLIIGLMGRSAAAGIFALALSIELFVYPGTSDHYHWMLLMAIIVTAGPGKISLDHFVRRKLLKPGPYDKTVDIH